MGPVLEELVVRLAMTTSATRRPAIIARVLSCIAGVWCCCTSAAAQLANDAADERMRAGVERFADSVVVVAPQKKDGTPASETGYGIIVGSRDGNLYIVTAWHVVFDGRDQTFTDHPHVRFRAQPSSDVDATRLVLASPSTYDDVAVLVVPNLADVRELFLSSGMLRPHRDEGAWVWTIGRAGDWSVSGAHGSFSGERNDPLRQSFDGLPTAPGSSGSAVIAEDGIVAMVLQANALETLATPIDTIKRRLRAWGIPTNLLEVTRDCAAQPGSGQVLNAGPAVIGFDALPGMGGALLNCYQESGYTIAPTEGDWRVGKGYGNPSPYIYFYHRGVAGEHTEGTITVKAAGHPFNFTSADLYSSVTTIPYRFTGYLHNDKVFITAGIVPNTFGKFATVSNAAASVKIDRLEIEMETYTEYAVANSTGIDNIRLTAAP